MIAKRLKPGSVKRLRWLMRSALAALVLQTAVLGEALEKPTFDPARLKKNTSSRLDVL